MTLTSSICKTTGTKGQEAIRDTKTALNLERQAANL